VQADVWVYDTGQGMSVRCTHTWPNMFGVYETIYWVLYPNGTMVVLVLCLMVLTLVEDNKLVFTFLEFMCLNVVLKHLSVLIHLLDLIRV
jgi:hypothetical protein